MSRSIDQAVRQLAARGYAVVDDVIPAADIAALRERTIELYCGDPGVTAKQTAPGKNLLAHLELLPAKGRLYESFFLHPAVHEIVAQFLGPDFIANDIYSMGLLPGYSGRPFHVDEPMSAPTHTLAVNVLYPLTDFTSDNGATRFLPGSHLYPTTSRDAFTAWLADQPTLVAGEVAVAAPAGSALLLLGGVYHAPGSNTTDQPRPALASLFTVPWMKPYIDFPRALPAPVLERASPTALRLFGFGSVVPHTERWSWTESTQGRALQWAAAGQPAAGIGTFDARQYTCAANPDSRP